MQRMSILAIAVTLVATAGTVHAQVSSASPGFSGTNLNDTQCSASSLDAATAGCSTSDSLSGTISSSSGGTASPANGSGSAARLSGGSMPQVSQPSGAGSPNPQTAVQLPGEAPDRSSQAAKTTAGMASGGATGAPSGGGALCSPGIPSSTGETNPASLVGGASPGGC